MPFKIGHKINNGRTWTDTARENYRISHKGMSGRKHSMATIIKMSESKRGDNHPNWMGGINSINNMIRSGIEYRQWRNEVFKRDNFTCQECGDNKGRNLNADHIKLFAIILKQNNITSYSQAQECSELWDINNGRTLCIDCHEKTDTYGSKGLKLIRMGLC